MSVPESLDLDQVRRQLLAHARMLRGAGIDWLPMSGAGMLAEALPQRLAQASSASGEREAGKPPIHRAATEPSIAAATPPAASLEIEDGLAAATGGMSVDQRRLALDLLAAEVRGCTRCAELCSTRTQTVFGQGLVGAEVCFLGEAPGADEDAQGFPFVGPAGQLLNRIISACGWKREEVYICNILKCRPPGNRTPLANEAANCRAFLERQLELVQPKYIVALGACAATNLLNTTLALGKLRGRFHDWRGIPVLVTYHPAFLLPHRSPEKKRDVWEDMKLLLTKMGRPIPAKGS